MSKNESVDYFLRFLNERFQTFRSALAEFLQALTNDNRTEKLTAAQNVLTCLDDLKRAMSENDRPNWIKPLEDRLNWYRKTVQSQPDAGLNVVNTVLQVNPQIESQKWQFADSAANAAIDFAAIYKEYYRGSRVK